MKKLIALALFTLGLLITPTYAQTVGNNWVSCSPLDQDKISAAQSAGLTFDSQKCCLVPPAAPAEWCNESSIEILNTDECKSSSNWTNLACDTAQICKNSLDKQTAAANAGVTLCSDTQNNQTNGWGTKDCTDTYAGECKCGIKLNTSIPFIGNCIKFGSSNSAGNWWNTTTVNQLNAFPILIGWLSRILLTVILVVAFMTVVVGGVMMSASGYDPSLYGKGKKLIRGVVISIAVIWAAGVILRLINPNFFT